MLNLLLVLVGLLVILAAEELSWHNKILSEERQRKFGHVALGLFVAVWPWLISWSQIKLLGIFAILFSLFNTFAQMFHYLGLNKRGGFGDIFYGLAILLCALLTDIKIFFALAILVMALADAAAALVGKQSADKWAFWILGQRKTILGSMAFWLTALFVLGVGVIGAHNYIDFQHYIILVAALPPILAILESISVWGMDNLIVPVVAVLALKLLA